ncbi:hypothetical protein K2224_01985 [Streptomyces sp. BHT-5-2]|uniref:hypothetical protein n=1 Tax=Streptomyces sp. BHT-5-2 TaxID=2866715 RepID=UPI001C8EFF1C|nr:hypothetical protein [Streptomyces sp. BHT-5-2]QZL02135.1 hypothetical protein K2224_01985 [Streptomyces sp. BHT-5-2]
MHSPQLTLCAALAACAVTTAPAYAAADGHGTRPAPAASHGPVGHVPTTAHVPAAHVAIALGQAGPGAARPAPAGLGAGRVADPAGTAPAVRLAPAPVARSRLTPDRVTARRELSSTSAVALVLAGGAVLVIAGQLLRLRLRLRRERQGSGGADDE